MTALIKNFAKSESGAVTVDWVVLTAAIVGLGLAVMAVVSGGIEDLSNDINTQLTNTSVGDGDFNPLN
jgi:Flp pilus assembly pilin Flp